MKIKYLGTGAAERVPAIFCKCAVCNNARKKGGKEIRTQTQILIDGGKLMIDFPGDAYHHMIKYGLDYNDISNLLLTHWHSDHLYAEDLAFRMQGYSQNLDNQLKVYGNQYTHDFFKRAFELEESEDLDRIQYFEQEAYRSFKIDDYTIYPIPAQHGKFTGDCFIYVIQNNDSAILYMHDTGYPTDEMIQYIASLNLTFNLVSMDCTSQVVSGGKSHMNIEQNIKFIDEMKTLSLIDDKTTLVANHFSHNGQKNYEEMVALFKEHQVIVSFDGIELEC